MKRSIIALAVVAMTAAVPSFAHDVAHMEQMRNPQHMLMMAYHKNVVAFTRVLDSAARQGDTVSPELARTAVAEMRRSVDQIEKLRAGQSFPPEMQKMMDQHLVTVKTQLRELESLTGSSRIPSQEVLKRTQFLLGGCDGAQCDLGARKGMRGTGAPCKGMQMSGGCGGCRDMEMMPQHRKMMEEMQQKIKAQDAELTALVEQMKLAPRDRKVDLLAEIVSRMVQQRTEFVNRMEKMQQEHMMHHQHMMQHGAAEMPPPPGMTQGGDDDSDMDMDDMDMENTQDQD